MSTFFFKQFFDNSEEVYELKYCSVNLGIRVVVNSEEDDDELVTSDEEFLYLNPNSETEDYDSDRSGFLCLVEEFVIISGQNVPKDCQGYTKPNDHEMIKKKFKSKAKTTKAEDKSPEQMVVDSDQESDNDKSVRPKRSSRSKTKTNKRTSGEKTNTKKIQKSMVGHENKQTSKSCIEIPEADPSFLQNDFFESHMQYFLSQTMTPTQTSAIIQQTGRFSYMRSPQMDRSTMTLPKEQKREANIMIAPVLALFDEDNHWPTILKTLQHSMFAFRNSSSVTRSLAHRLLAHYDWTKDKVECLPKEKAYYEFLHNDILQQLVNDCLLRCDYSRTDILQIIGGQEGEANAWTFISKLIQFILNQTIKSQKNAEEKSNVDQNNLEGQDLLAISHLQLIVDLLFNDFKQFLNESDNYCTDIRGQNKPLICRVIWSHKSPNYLNSTFKYIIWLIVQVFKKVPKPETTQLLVQMFRIFDLGAECIRIASGNVRPFLNFSLNQPMPTTELVQQLKHESIATNFVMEQLLIASTLPWVTLQFCGLLLANFIVDLKTKYLVEKHRQISLKLVIESLTNARLTSNKSSANTSVSTPTNKTPQNSETESSSKKTTSRRRLSINVVTTPKQNNKTNQTLLRRNKYGENALHIACKKGDSLKVIEILEQTIIGLGPDPNDKDNAGYTPLGDAVYHKQVDCVRALIDWQKKSNKLLDFKSAPEGQTPLHDAIALNAIECAKLLIESGGPELLDVKRKGDDLTPRNLIRTKEMEEAIKLTQDQFKHKSLKISVDGKEEAKLFVKILKSFISSYVKTTNLTKFLQFNGLEPEADPEVDQDSWPDAFSSLFKRDIADTDIPFLIQELSVFLKLPKVVEHLMNLFESNAKEEIEDLEFMTEVLFRKKKLTDLFK